ncbi:hypothetical protein FKM82_005716 [Ascaphus truei]
MRSWEINVTSTMAKIVTVPLGNLNVPFLQCNFCHNRFTLSITNELLVPSLISLEQVLHEVLSYIGYFGYSCPLICPHTF